MVKKVGERPRPVVEEVTEEVLPTSAAEPEPPIPAEPEKPKKEPARDLPTGPLGSEASKRGCSPKTVILVAFITALLVGALVGGIYVYFNGISKLDKEETVTPQPSPTATAGTASPTPTASPEAEIALAAFKVSVLNGSGKIGEATKVKNLLTKAGFKVAATGNAPTFDFTNTIIEAKENVPQSVVDTIKEALADYSLEVGENLATSNSYDVVVTVGTK